MKEKLLKLKTQLCLVLNNSYDTLYNWERQECERLVQLVDTIILDNIENRNKELSKKDYFIGCTLQTKFLFKNWSQLTKIAELIDDIVASEVH